MNSIDYSMEYPKDQQLSQHLLVKFLDHLYSKNALTYLDDVVMQSQTEDEIFTVLEQYHQI